MNCQLFSTPKSLLAWALLTASLMLICLSGTTNQAAAQSGQPRPRPLGNLPARETDQRSNAFARTDARSDNSDAEAESDEEPLNPEMLVILRDWERYSSKIQKLHGRHQRFVYNKVFAVESRNIGLFYYEAPDHGRIDLVPAEIADGEESRRVDAKGNPFRLAAGNEERWVCNGREIIDINVEEKTYEVVTLPEEMRGANIINGPLPFLFGMPAADATKRFRLKLLADNAKQAKIQAIPRFQSDAASYAKATILLDKQTYLPKAVQLIDNTGNLETVYLFSELVINQNALTSAVQKVFGKDPFRPNLKDYTRGGQHEDGIEPAGGIDPLPPPKAQTRVPLPGSRTTPGSNAPRK
jgi:TIGR03009 family protein